MDATLITTYHHPDHLGRRLELVSALLDNAELSLVARILVMATAEELRGLDEVIRGDFDRTPPAKITPTPIDGRPTFADMMDLASMGKGWQVIHNGDIAFDSTLGILTGHRPGQRIAYAITRHDIDPLGRWVPHSGGAWSQDAWAFKPGQARPIPAATFPMGVPGCDNRFAYLLRAAGYRVTNPGLSVRALHHHYSGHRTYTKADRVPGPYYPPRPISIGPCHGCR